MPKAILTLEDTNEHQVNLLLTHLNGFDNESQAHKLSIVILKFLEDQTVKSMPVPDESVSDYEKEFARRAEARKGILLAR